MKEQPMPKKEREEVILQYLSDTSAAFPPEVLFYNLRQEWRVQFSKKTLLRDLDDLDERGYIEKVVPEKAYFRITRLGEQYLAGDLDASELEDES